MSGEDGDIDEDKPETLAIEKSPASVGVEQKKKEIEKGWFNRGHGRRTSKQRVSNCFP
jgi:hypothetical protein